MEGRFKGLFLDHTPFLGGAQLALIRHLNYLDLKRFKVLAAVSDPALIWSGLGDERRGDIKVSRVRFGKIKTFPVTALINLVVGWVDLGALVIRIRPDFVVINSERPLYFYLPLCLFWRVPLIVFLRDFEYSRSLLDFSRLFVSQFICVSASIRDFYFPKGEKKARVVYVGTDICQKLDRISTEEVRRLRQECGGVDRQLFGYVGRLVYWKGVLILPEIARSLLKIGFNSFKIIVVGSGENQAGQAEAALRRKIREDNLEDYFHLTGFCPEVAIWYKTFDLLLQTSQKMEPFATVIVEALSASLPVIATNLGGSREVIRPGQNGFLVSADPEEFAKAILSFVAEPGRRREMGERAKASARPYEEVKITGEIEKLYLELLL